MRYIACIAIALALAGCERVGCATQDSADSAAVQASELAKKDLSSITLTVADLNGAVAAYKQRFREQGRTRADAQAATERCAEENWNLETTTPTRAIIYAAPNFPAAQVAMLRDIGCRATRDLMFEEMT